MVFLVNHGWILARLPQALFKSLQQELHNNGPMLLVEIIIWLLVIICCVPLQSENLFNMLVVQRQVILNKI
jgi:hypothetical protein